MKKIFTRLVIIMNIMMISTLCLYCGTGGESLPQTKELDASSDECSASEMIEPMDAAIFPFEDAMQICNEFSPCDADAFMSDADMEE